MKQIKLTQSYRSNDCILKLCEGILEGTCSFENQLPHFLYNKGINYDTLIKYINALNKKETFNFQVITPYTEEVNKIIKLLKKTHTIDKFGYFRNEKILVNKNYFTACKNMTKKIILANGEIGRYTENGNFEINGQTFSVKEVFKILYAVEDIMESGNEAKITWCYKAGDELMYQKGLEFQKFLEIPVELVER